ncbi:hypothetical protein KIH87_04580 [Paraneptunicella aestuarii]|uniref:hypothetical protein n=1 Tax=Paraneptunicella aestuarii TaxID=2831148 RepID=UPI001E5DC83F|nr:hypothetical protein [Paraneptunicella aestuarii]UAA39638.1 hypothetical protein KIH87_04580 [Paraneptunicella aestuarii]
MSGTNSNTPSLPSVHMVIKTNALIYDDRFRKEVQSLQRIGCQVSASVLEDANQARNGHDYGDGVQQNFRVLSLLTKRLLKSRLFVLFHLSEFILRTCLHIIRSKPDVVWIHDPILMVFVPFLQLLKVMGFTRKIIWDQHELPIKRIDQSGALRRVFAWFCRGADLVVAANQERLDYLKDHYPGFDKVAHGVIRNYSDHEFIEQPSKPLPDDLVNWLDGREYFLVQSGVVELRNFRAVAEAIIPDDTLPVIVAVGGGDKALINELQQRYGERFQQRVYLIGKVPQMELTRYLDGSVASIIFYQKSYGINNWLCEPNRLFQALNRNRPVIVGNNPPMASVLQEYPLGEVVADDGSEPEYLKQALKQFMQNRGQLPALSEAQIANIGWESQDPHIAELVRC